MAWIQKIFKAIFGSNAMPDPDAHEDSESKEDSTVDTKGFVLNVPPDAPDIRDRMYQPALIRIPNEIAPEWSDLNIRNQHREGACTGFALAGAIDLLNLKRGRSHVKVSTRMLYEMARRFDEWSGEDYEGSSILGRM